MAMNIGGLALQQMPLNMVGGNKYGRYNKISVEETFNMIVSDDWLVSYTGYELAAQINPSATGRAVFSSERLGKMIAVIGNGVYAIDPPNQGQRYLSYFRVGTINTFAGDVFIDENIAGQIAICDGHAIWIYNWQVPSNPGLIAATLPIDPQTGFAILPGYVTYQDGYFITVNRESAGWFLSAPNNGLDWNWSAIDGPVTTTIQTKPTNAVAVLRAPGRGNLLYIFGGNVTEMWYDVGATLFPYQRSTSISVDYGCLSPNTISAMDTIVAWLGSNERSGPVIMVSAGAEITKLSTDGIDFKLAALKHPEQSYGSFFKQDGHLFYQLTFSSPEDNLSLVYDFNSKMFFTATDENGNYFPAEEVAFFQDAYYFVSIRDGNIYRMSSKLFTYDYTAPDDEVEKVYEIPRSRQCAPNRLPDSSRFIVTKVTFPADQGNDALYMGEPNANPTTDIPYQPRIDLSFSKDGGEAFSSRLPYMLNPQGYRQNRIIYRQLGSGNDFTFKFDFLSKSYVAVSNGLVTYYQ